MFPQHGWQQKVNTSSPSSQKIASPACPRDDRTEEEQLAIPSMWPNRSMAGQRQRGGHSSDITNENTPRYEGQFKYSECEFSPSRAEESNYTFSSSLSPNTMERQASSSNLSASASLRLATLQSQDYTRVCSPTTPFLGETSSNSEGPLQVTTASLSGPPKVRYNSGSIAQGISGNALVGDSEVKSAMEEEDLDTLDPKKPSGKGISIPLGSAPHSISDVSRPEVPPPSVLEVGLVALALEDTSSEGSPMPDTDADSDGEWLDERPSVIALSSSEQQDAAPSTAPHSKWTTKFTTHTGHKGSASTSTTTSKSTNHSASTSLSSNHSRKRMLDNLDGHSAGRDDDPPERPDLDMSEPQDLKSPVKLACPFFKHDPGKYNPINYHTCATTAWCSIDRLKEHLFRAHMARPYCEICKQTLENMAALESRRSVPVVELSGFCNCQDPSEPVGITQVMADRLKARWRNTSTREKWDRIYSILFPDEVVPVPYFDAVRVIPIHSGQSQRTPSFEKQFWRKLRCALRTRFDRSANDYIKSLPDDAKAEIVKDMVDECVLQLTLSKNSPNETPRIRAPPEQLRPANQALPMDEQTMELPTENWDSSGGESWGQGLGLTLPSSELPPGPPSPSSFFDEQYRALEVSDVNQWPYINDWNDGQSSPSMH